MGKRTPSKWLTLLAACFGLLMLYIDLFIVNVALPTIAQDFRAPLGTVSWTVSGYVLMIGVLPMGIGRLGDLWGQRVVYLAGVALFSIASLLCGLASSMTALIVFRVIQGIGAAIMTPGTLAIIMRAFPRASMAWRLDSTGESPVWVSSLARSLVDCSCRGRAGARSSW